MPKEYQESLSYFEYTTLLAGVSFEGLDYAVMEAGLGGEFDATNVYEKELSLITLIDFDHQAFLGETIKDIAATKIRSIKKNAILGNQKYKEVEEVAEKIAEEKGAKLYILRELLSKKEKSDISAFVKRRVLPSFFADNLSLAYAGAKILGIDVDLNGLDTKIFGRMQKIKENIIVDVGHNPSAACAIVKEIKAGTVLVYNSFEDKNYKEVLKILKPKIKRVEIIGIDDERIVDKEKLIETLKELDIDFCDYKGIRKEENYFVFGSFRVVEEFLKKVTK